MTILSCLAANRRIYLVANIGRHVSRGGEALMFNTDLAFDRCDEIIRFLFLMSKMLRMGFLVAVYDKRNLFMTEKKIFNQPELEVVTFETDFGKFGLMTCFDAMYEHPFLDLVEQEVIG